MTSIPDFQASEFLDSVGYQTLTIAGCLQKNRLDQRQIELVLFQYSKLAFLDGRLIDAARCDRRSVDHAIRLLEAHVKLISCLAVQNYTIAAASVKWYSYKKLRQRNRLPFIYRPRCLSQLQSAVDNIMDKGAVVRDDIVRYQVRFSVSLAESFAYDGYLDYRWFSWVSTSYNSHVLSTTDISYW